jgi:hypothetical protein
MLNAFMSEQLPLTNLRSTIIAISFVVGSVGAGFLLTFGSKSQWCFDIMSHSWERFDTKLRPSARSGHRMAMWKHLLFLFGVRSFSPSFVSLI